MIPARCASTIFVDNPSDAAVKRLLAEWADADFFEPHDIIRTVILQADIANLRSLVLTLRFPVTVSVLENSWSRNQTSKRVCYQHPRR